MKNKLLLLTSAFLLLACQQSEISEAKATNEAATETSQAVKTAETTVLENKPVMDAEVVVGTIAEVPAALAVKAGSNLKVEHRLSAERAKVGVPYDIELDFSGPAKSSFIAEFVTTPGLSLSSTASASIQMNESGKSGTQTITLLPQKEGIYFVSIFRDGVNQQQKPTAIKVVVGDKDIKEYMQTMGELVEQEDGSKVISMKADEG